MAGSLLGNHLNMTGLPDFRVKTYIKQVHIISLVFKYVKSLAEICDYIAEIISKVTITVSLKRFRFSLLSYQNSLSI